MPNGVYTGPAKVRVIPPGVTGEDLVREGLVPPRSLAARRSAARGRHRSARVRRKVGESAGRRGASSPGMHGSGGRAPGPRSKRAMGVHRCAVCGQIGHNARTCGRPRPAKRAAKPAVKRSRPGVRQAPADGESLTVFASSLIRVRALRRANGVDLVVTVHPGRA